MATKSSVKPIGLKPLGSRVIIEAIEVGDQTTGGIYLPENAKEKPQKGLVLAIGPGTRDSDGKLIPLDVSVGDQVIFGKYAGSGSAFAYRSIMMWFSALKMAAFSALAVLSTVPECRQAAIRKVRLHRRLCRALWSGRNVGSDLRHCPPEEGFRW